MDTISHAFWGAGLFGYRGKFALALLFGALPDLLSFGLVIVTRIVTGSYTPGKPAIETLPSWLFYNYDFMHSFVVAFAIIFIVAIWRKDLAFVMLGWPFHIVLDFPFHSIQYFPTKIFWPFSDFVINGIPWSRPIVWLPNFFALLILFYWRKKKNSRS